MSVGLEKFRKKHHTVYDILELGVVVAVAWLFYQGLGAALQTPQPMLSVVSGSMEPNLHVGDLLIMAKADYQVGDIAAYTRDSITIIHRIIEIREDGYVFKGDHNSVADPEVVAPSRVLGKVRLAIPLLGFPRMALRLFGI
jgi:signal peptidase